MPQGQAGLNGQCWQTPGSAVAAEQQLGAESSHSLSQLFLQNRRVTFSWDRWGSQACLEVAKRIVALWGV